MTNRRTEGTRPSTKTTARQIQVVRNERTQRLYNLPQERTRKAPKRRTLKALDVVCIVCMVLAVIVCVYGMAHMYQVGYAAGLHAAGL